MQKLEILKKYLHYRLFSSTRYDIHPPFLFELVTQVFKNKSVDPDYLKIEDLKHQLIKDNRKIIVTDLGAGSASRNRKERKIGFIARSSSKSKKYGRLLSRMVHYFQPQTIIELGTSLGFSSAYLASGNPESKVITIEGCPNIAKLAQENFNKLGIRNITLVNGSFDDVLPGVLNFTGRIDFVFMDGNHKKEPTIKYFEQCLTKAVNETVFVFDDIHWSGGMEEAWNHIINHPSVTLSVDIFFMGIVFLKKELTKQHFIIRF
jgi:predicted O-methyltransferase YrrM